jgi:hypothetical protein
MRRASGGREVATEQPDRIAAADESRKLRRSRLGSPLGFGIDGSLWFRLVSLL